MGKNSVPHAAALVKAPDMTAKWQQHKRQAQVIALQLAAAGLIKRGERMAVCSDIITYRYCRACDSWHVDRANLCRDRLCPTCNWRLSLQRYATMQRIVAPLVPRGLTWALITLTVRNCPPPALAATVDALMSCWHRALARKDMRAALGWARGLELTYNADAGTLHPHMHILVAWPPDQDRSKSLISAWMELTAAAGLTASVQAQHAAVLGAPGTEDVTRDILETYKYSIKGSDVLRMPVGVLKEVARHWGGRRLMALGGCLKTAAAEREVEDIQYTPVTVCRSCGSPVLDRYIARWSMGEQAYKIMELHQVYPNVYGSIVPDASGAGTDDQKHMQACASAGEREQRPPDMPVLLNTVNGRILMYPGGSYQLIDPPISP